MATCDLLPLCMRCAHLRGVEPGVGWACDAFPRGIPTDILASVKDHRRPYQGDGGVTFEPRRAAKESEDDMPQIATDPPVSEAQRRAMWAEASGHGNLGIPHGVAKEFAEADPGGKLPERARDMAPSKWSLLKRLWNEWLQEEEDEPEHQGDDEIRHDPRSGRFMPGPGASPRGRGEHRQQSGYHKSEADKHYEAMHAHASKGNLAGQREARAKWLEHKKLAETHEAKSRESAGYGRWGRDEDWTRKGRAASVAFTTHDGKVLLLRRADDDAHRPGEWCFPGGQADDDEDFEACARREAREEVGDCGLDGLRELDRRRTPGDLEHATYVVPVKDEFEPKLSREHSAHVWAPITDLPENTHPGVRQTVEDVIGRDAQNPTGKLSETTRSEIDSTEHREDMPDSMFLLPHEKKYPVGEKRDGEWRYTRSLLLAAARRARMEGRKDLAEKADAIRDREFPSVVQDMAVDWDAHDWRRSVARHEHQVVDGRVVDLATGIAFDRESVRDKDEDGRLRVSSANISKANVCPYYGKEIPDYEGLGLDPERKYMLLRDPEELRKAVATFNNLPILSTHVPVTADSFPQDKIIGSTGTDAEFAEPYLRNSLVFWPQSAIDDIESNVKKELSAGYRYRADMTPGEFKGVRFDGVMRDIRGNHMALVREGRVGDDVVVGDAALGGEYEEEDMVQLSPKAAMAEGMFLGRFGPKLTSAGMAMDAAAALFNPIFMGVTSRNFATQRPALDAALRATLRTKLGADADIEDVTNLLQAIEGVEAGSDNNMASTEENAALPSYMREDDEDADDETPEEREEDDCYDRRARDARDRLGRDETEEEMERSEEEMEYEPDRSESGADVLHHVHHFADDRRRAADRRRADDRRARRAADARDRLGRDETEEEREKREREQAAEDRVRASDRRHLGRDYRRARDAHRTARDAHRKMVDDWRKARDAHRAAMDRRDADDAAARARDMKRADDECRAGMDALKRARDARHRARDARRAHDRRMGRDEPPPFSGRPNVGGGMEPITKAAMDAAIQDAVRENDRRHHEIAEARRLVRPKVGELAMDSSIHSAADVYSRALTALGVEHAGIREPAALRRLFEVAPRPGGGERSSTVVLAHDASPATSFASFAKRFPGAERIERI